MDDQGPRDLARLRAGVLDQLRSAGVSCPTIAQRILSPPGSTASPALRAPRHSHCAETAAVPRASALWGELRPTPRRHLGRDDALLVTELQELHADPFSMPVRIVDAWTELPGGSSTHPARPQGAKAYVPPDATVELPRRIGLHQTGTHEVHVVVQDGWGREVEGTTTVAMTGRGP